MFLSENTEELSMNLLPSFETLRISPSTVLVIIYNILEILGIMDYGKQVITPLEFSGIR
jgi:hypothetical protein